QAGIRAAKVQHVPARADQGAPGGFHSHAYLHGGTGAGYGAVAFARECETDIRSVEKFSRELVRALCSARTSSRLNQVNQVYSFGRSVKMPPMARVIVLATPLPVW